MSKQTPTLAEVNANRGHNCEYCINTSCGYHEMGDRRGCRKTSRVESCEKFITYKILVPRRTKMDVAIELSRAVDCKTRNDYDLHQLETMLPCWEKLNEYWLKERLDIPKFIKRGKEYALTIQEHIDALRKEHEEMPE